MINDPTQSRYRYIAFKGGSYRRFVQDDKDKSLERSSVIHSQEDIPAHGTYGALLFDPKWRARREQILARDARQCVVCKSSDKLQVHHRQYQFVVRNKQFKLPWEYPDHLLITLCENCHKRGHSKFKVPTINI